MNDWKHLGTDKTDSSGRLVYSLPSRDIEAGVYKVKMIVRYFLEHILLRVE